MQKMKYLFLALLLTFTVARTCYAGDAITAVGSTLNTGTTAFVEDQYFVVGKVYAGHAYKAVQGQVVRGFKVLANHKVAIYFQHGTLMLDTKSVSYYIAK